MTRALWHTVRDLELVTCLACSDSGLLFQLLRSHLKISQYLFRFPPWEDILFCLSSIHNGTQPLISSDYLPENSEKWRGIGEPKARAYCPYPFSQRPFWSLPAPLSLFPAAP